MIMDISNIIDNKFVITAEIKEGTKVYLIGEDIFTARFNNNEEWTLDSNDISDLRYDGLMVASLVAELQELENTYIVRDIVDMYVRRCTLKQTRKLITDKLRNLNSDSK